MSIYRIQDERIIGLDETTFQQQGLKERQDLQNLLKHNIGVIAEVDPMSWTGIAVP